MPTRSAVVPFMAALAALALGCASPPPAPAPPAKPAAPPPTAEPGHEKTAADPALQLGVTKLIDQCEREHGAAGRVTDTRFEELVDQTVVESWIVTRDTAEVVYLVKLTPGAEGVEIWVQCPPKPRVK
jgi:hypothetical protein